VHLYLQEIRCCRCLHCRFLQLLASQVTMANFPPLLQLSRLELGATDVDYAGLVAIGALTSLQRLSLTDCQVSSASRGTGVRWASWRCAYTPAAQGL